MRATRTERGDRLSVALDATPLLGVKTGVGEFCQGALGGLASRRELTVSAFAVSWRRRHELRRYLPEGVGSSQHAMPARPLHWAWSRVPGPPIEWFVGDVDVVHGTNYVVPPSRRCARVVTVHDLTAVRYPELCDAPSRAFPRMVRRAVAGGAWVHTPSRFVADEVVSELGLDPARVRPVHHGIPGIRDGGRTNLGEVDEPRPAGDARRFLSQHTNAEFSRYVLAVGTVEPRKDYPLLVRAFDELAGEVTDLALVIAGADGWGTGQLDAALQSAHHTKRILRLGYVGSEVRELLMAQADAVAYPSVYEGFGMVPLEAMVAGTPVVATSAGAVPEVVGDGALLVSPGDAAGLAHALHTVLEDDDARRKLIERGHIRTERFSWTASAEGLAALYAEAAG